MIDDGPDEVEDRCCAALPDSSTPPLSMPHADRTARTNADSTMRRSDITVTMEEYRLVAQAGKGGDDVAGDVGEGPGDSDG